MIQSVQIQNFKSIVDLTLELGTFNVLIGANGCGKSNILEAIAFGAAASADKLDQEFFGSRGIRMTSPEFMFSAFNSNRVSNDVSINFIIDDVLHFFELLYSKAAKKWVDKNLENLNDLKDLHLKELKSSISELSEHKIKDKAKQLLEVKNSIKKIEANLKEIFSSIEFHSATLSISYFLMYSPEQTSLRRFSDENQIYPLGIKGEGLFQYLKELSKDEKNAEVLNEIKECLLLLDWYEDFKLPKNLMSNEFALSIKDKYLNENLQFFDQRSTNEGFLYLLFYATLFTTKDTPQFFAIDNIDASFNPKLCMQVTKMLAQLAKKHGKQVIVTTQNPAILDGLDLEDDNQRLFVVRRNEEGHTKAKRIGYKAERTMKLSEVWTNGFIGGLPDNF